MIRLDNYTFGDKTSPIQSLIYYKEKLLSDEFINELKKLMV